MEKADLDHLIRQVQAGDLIALAELVEWGLDAAMLQYVGEGYLPLWVQVRLRRRLDTLHRYRDADHARGARVRELRTAKLEAVIDRAIEDYRLPFLVEKPHKRASYLQGKITLRLNDYRLKKAPGIRTIRTSLRKKGFLTKNDPLERRRAVKVVVNLFRSRQ